MESSRPPGCENCQEECTIHLTQIVNNKIKKIDMCENCPNAKSIQDPTQFNLLSNLVEQNQTEETSGSVSLTCESCGYTEEKLKKTGRLGCAHCYEAFSDTLNMMLTSMHKGSSHVGKVPSTHKKGSLRKRVLDLEKQLEAHIKEESYEDAAQIRDEINELKQQMAQNPPAETP